MPMIVIVINKNVVCRQSQIDEFIKPYTMDIIIIKSMIDGSIEKTIKHRFKKNRYRRKKNTLFLNNNKLRYTEILDYMELDKCTLNNIIHNSKDDKMFQPYLDESETNMYNIISDTLNDNGKYTEDTYLFKEEYKCIDRFKCVHSVQFEEFCKGNLRYEEWIYYQELPEFKGTFKDSILLNNFNYWNRVEEEIKHYGFQTKVYSVKDIIIYETFRHKLGVENYSNFSNIAQYFDKNLLVNIGLGNKAIPEPYHFSHYFQNINSRYFVEFFNILLEECYKYELIKPRIILGDGLFTHSWAGDFKKDKYGTPTDPDSSITVHDRKFYGKGFIAIALYAWCRSRWLPIFFKVYTGNINESKAFSEVFTEFLKITKKT